MNDVIFFFFHNLANQSNFIDKVIIFLADTFPYIVVALAFVFLIFHYHILKSVNIFRELMQKWREFFFVFCSAGLAWFLAKIFKLLIHTPRPFDVFPNIYSLFLETGYAFPSGHSATFMALAIAIYFYHKKMGYLFIIFALLIGLARIIAGVHFPIDILGGFILGAGVSYFMYYILEFAKSNKSV